MRTHNIHNPRQLGFTLIEVMIAVAIAAVSLGVVYESLGFAQRRLAGTAEGARAVLNAQSLLSEIRASENPLGARQAGTTADGMAWTLTVRPYPEITVNRLRRRPYDVAVTMHWGHGRKLLIESIELGQVRHEN